MPFENEFFDNLNCMYLFDELSHEERTERVLEFSRVLKPGGLLAFKHSSQLGDKDQLIDVDMIELLEEKGFERYNDPQNASWSKVFCLIKKHASNSKSSDGFQDTNLDIEVD